MHGRVIAYQFGTTDAFGGNNKHNNYVDGASLTRGSPRSHIWTFAAALDEQVQYLLQVIVRLKVSGIIIIFSLGLSAVTILGGQYTYQEHILYSANPLWDGVIRAAAAASISSSMVLQGSWAPLMTLKCECAHLRMPRNVQSCVA